MRCWSAGADTQRQGPGHLRGVTAGAGWRGHRPVFQRAAGRHQCARPGSYADRDCAQHRYRSFQLLCPAPGPPGASPRARALAADAGPERGTRPHGADQQRAPGAVPGPGPGLPAPGPAADRAHHLPRCHCLARRKGCALQGLAMDAQGLLPQALAEALDGIPAAEGKVLYLTPRCTTRPRPPWARSAGGRSWISAGTQAPGSSKTACTPPACPITRALRTWRPWRPRSPCM